MVSVFILEQYDLAKPVSHFTKHPHSMKILLISCLLLICIEANAQSSNVLNTAVPFLLIAPDARATGMGNAGIATSPDVHSIFWNTSKLAFLQNQFGVSLSYTPWLHEVSSDFYLFDASSYWKIDSVNIITASFRYFHWEVITFTNASGAILGKFRPVEYTAHAGYARKFSKEFSAGINLGYVRSNLAEGFTVNNLPILPQNALMADLSFLYSHSLKKQSDFRKYNFGIVISNIGNKIGYTSNPEFRDFLPANLGIGSAFDFQFGKQHEVSLALDLNKLLVPTPDSNEVYRSESVTEGIYRSFSDAPDGFGEEIRETTISTGAEYWFRQTIALRTGYFYEDKNKGDRQYLSFGAGVKYSFIQMDLSYWLSTSANESPIDKTFHASISFNVNSFRKNPSKQS